MSTTPTNQPVPSEKPQDLKFNAGKIDEFVTSMAKQYIDRFGHAHYTIEGLRWVAQQAISAFGYITIDSFQAGASLTLPNQVLRDTSTGEYYRWDGVFPKVVPAGSTPDSTGGVGVGAWLSVGDAVIRGQLYAIDGLKLVGKCSSVSQLRTVVAESNGQLITVDSYRPGSNKGGGIFQWNAASNDPDDGGAVIAVTGVATGRWVRQVNGRYTPEMYGADGTKTNDPSAIKSVLEHQKYVLFSGVYYMNDEFVTNGHNIEGGSTGEYYGDGSKTKIVFFGGLSAKQAVRNEITKSSYKNITFEPESWDPVNGYTGTGLRLHRTLDAENCNWIKFKEFGIDLWEDVANAHTPYYSQFRNCNFDYNGYAGVRFAQGANSIQIYGGTARWNGSPSYGEMPTDSSTGWDGVVFIHSSESYIPPPDNPMTLQGNIIDGIDASYNARYGVNVVYGNQSVINVGYSEANHGTTDINIENCMGCTINVLVAQKGASVNVPSIPTSNPRNIVSFPNSIVINGIDFASGVKDGDGRYIIYRLPKFGSYVMSYGSTGDSGLRAYDDSGSLESFTQNNGRMLIRANAGTLPIAEEKYSGTFWRDTSTGPNQVYVCVEQSPNNWIWSKIN